MCVLCAYSVVQIDVYRAVVINALFLIRQEKGQKKPTQGALYVAIPRAESVPLCIPRRTYDSTEHLNLHPEHDKNVPIFAVLRGAEEIRQGASRHTCALSRNSAGLPVSEGWFLGGGVFVKSPLLCRFLWLLSCSETRK